MTEGTNLIETQLREYVASLRDRIAELETETRMARAQLRSAEETLRRINAPREPGPSSDWACSVEAIADCKTVRSALVRMASLNNGILRVTPAARVLIEAGLPEGTVVSRVAAGVYARIRNRPEWEHSGPGEYRYVGEAEDDP